MEKYFEINEEGHNIRCKLYFNKGIEIKKVILFSHGFAGHKDNGACQKFADRILSKYKGIAVLIYDLPSHGNDVKKKIVLQDCMTYMNLVLEYIKTEFNTDQIYSYATSFGGYLVLNYIKEYGNPFVKIALRCPAINMVDVLTQTIMKNDDFDKLRKGKNVKVGFDRKIEVNPSFLMDLEQNDIRKYEYIEYAEEIIILHGTKDEVVSFDEVKQFADDNIIEFIPVENADHRFQNPACMEAATKAVLDFFEL